MESKCVVVACTSKASDKLEIMSLLGTTITDMDSFYILDWEEWYEAIGDGCLCAVAKAKCPKEGGEQGKEEDGLQQPTDAPVARERKPSDATPRLTKQAPPQNNPRHPSSPLPWQLCLQRRSTPSLLPRRERKEFPVPLSMHQFLRFLIWCVLQSAKVECCSFLALELSNWAQAMVYYHFALFWVGFGCPSF